MFAVEERGRVGEILANAVKQESTQTASYRIVAVTCAMQSLRNRSRQMALMSKVQFLFTGASVSKICKCINILFIIFSYNVR